MSEKGSSGPQELLIQEAGSVLIKDEISSDLNLEQIMKDIEREEK